MKYIYTRFANEANVDFIYKTVLFVWLFELAESLVLKRRVLYINKQLI